MEVSMFNNSDEVFNKPINVYGKAETAERLKNEAFAALREAETKMYSFAAFLDVGDERTKAFEVFENIRNAARVG